jgi:hypothetical protein
MTVTAGPTTDGSQQGSDLGDAIGDAISDEELTALALAADPDTPVAPDATVWLAARESTLPAAYLPAASVRSRPASRLRTVTVLIVIAAFLSITALGFCATYGQLVHA